MAKRTRHTYSPRKRATILAAAQRDNLTANDVKKKFGVVPVTYYSWRKKEGLTGDRGRKATLPALRNNGAVFTARVQAKVRAIVPRIVRDEVARSLGAFFASSRGPGRPRKVLS
jgi:transposase-like protein